MFKASLGILGVYFIIDAIRLQCTNPKYAVTLYVIECFLLIAGAYCLWYDWNVRRKLKKHLQILRNRRAKALKEKHTTLIDCELDLNFAYRMKIATQLNNPTYYRKQRDVLNNRIQQAGTMYVLLKQLYR